MDRIEENNVEPKAEWLAPELKKIDLQQITAAGGGRGTDGGFTAGPS